MEPYLDLVESVVSVHVFLVFAQLFLYVNQNNPVRHAFLALYGYVFYLYLTMEKKCFVTDLEQRNHTHGQFM